MSVSDIVAATLPVVRALERLGVPYYLGGSVASSLHGVARATVDADLVAALTLEHVDAFVGCLGDAYYVDADMVRDAIRRRASFNLVHLETMLKVDVYLPGGAAYDQESFRRRAADVLDDALPDETRCYVATPEDVVLHKLHWYRLGNEVSDRQWHDIVGVLKVQAGALDLAYLQRWAAELGVVDLLERALDAARRG